MLTPPPEMNAKSTFIAPYWTRFSSFFLYPLSLDHMVACIGFGLLSGVANSLFFLGNIVISLLVLASTLRYGYKVLERTARGNLDDGLGNLDSTGKYRPYKQFVVIAIGLTLAGYSSIIGGPHLAMVLLVVFAMILPANTMLLALTDDLGESISPPRLWWLMHGVGVPYLGLCACLLLLSSGSGVLLSLLEPVLPEALVGAVGGFVGAYFIIVMFRLMGYALYQYHDVLDLDVDVSFENSPDRLSEDPVKRRAADLAAMLKEGRYEEAIALARDDLTANPDDLSANLRLHRLLLAVPEQEPAMLAHAAEWLPKLMRKGNAHQAVDVLPAIWKHQPEYLPTQGAFYLPLAETLFDTRRYDSAARLIRGFDRRFPGHADIPAIYLLGARLLIDHQRDEGQARRVLEALRQHFPESTAAAEALKLLALLDRLAGVTSA